MDLETYHFTGCSYNTKITQEDLIRFNAAANSHCRTARTVIQLESLQATEPSALRLDWQFSALCLCTDVLKSIGQKDSVMHKFDSLLQIYPTGWQLTHKEYGHSKQTSFIQCFSSLNHWAHFTLQATFKMMHAFTCREKGRKGLQLNNKTIYLQIIVWLHGMCK